MFIRQVCAWCGCHMGIKKFTGINGSGPSISHGICPECIPTVTVEMEKIAARYRVKNHNSVTGKENSNE